MHDRLGGGRKRHDVPSYRFTPSPPLSTAPTMRLPIVPGGSAALPVRTPPCAAPRRDDDLVKDQPNGHSGTG